MPLDEVPFYGAYVARKRQNEEQGTRELQQAAQVMTLQSALQKRAQEEGFRRDLEALGPEPTQEAITGVASKYSDPKSLLDIHQKSLDRKAAAGDRALQFAQTLDLRQQALQQQKDAFEQRTQDAQARAQFEQWYKTQSLQLTQQAQALNTSLRQMGMEIQRQGQNLQLARFDAQKSEREEREIEGAIGKTANRMKDVQPVWTAAQQLNDVLARYTPDDIPGVGYAKNTDIGKVLLTQEGKDVSSSIKLFGNSVLKAMSGQAVTAPEEIRQMAAQMADGRFGAQDFYIAWPRMSQWVNDQVALATAGLTPKAKERFLERTGLKLDPIAPRFTFDGKALKDTRGPSTPAAPAPPPPPPGFRVNQ